VSAAGLRAPVTAPATAAAFGRATYTVEQAGEILGISRAAAYEAVQRGEIPHLRIGRRIVVPRRPLDRMVGIEDSEMGL
jgi:excisionase family DNA binding protein